MKDEERNNEDVFRIEDFIKMATVNNGDEDQKPEEGKEEEDEENSQNQNLIKDTESNSPKEKGNSANLGGDEEDQE